VTGGKWVARWYVGCQEYQHETLPGVADDAADADGVEVLNFAQAQTKVRAHVAELRRVAKGIMKVGPYTVADAIEQYLAWLEHNRKSASDSRARARAHILPKLGKIEAAKLMPDHIRGWLQNLAASPARLRTAQGQKQQYRAPIAGDEALRRRRATANRVLTILKAALNHAWRDGKIASDDAWRRVEPFQEVEAARVRYLNVQEAVRLINAADPDLRLLVQAALATGARYGELARLEVRDFNPDADTLHIHRSKSGRDRHIALTEEGVALFRRLTAGRKAAEPMLLKDGGSRWLPSHQFRRMNEACSRARIEPAISFHILRHTFASLAVMGGAPLIVIAKTLGHTDTRMVEKHYGHLAPSYVAEAIRAAAPRFGVGSAPDVAAMPNRPKSQRH
jgi:integrase